MRPSRSSLDLVVMVGLVGLAVLAGAFSLLSQVPGGTLVRSLVGIPTVLFAPGYAITAALWPHGGLRQAERLTLSLGLSLALAVLGGLLLYWTHVGLWPLPWSLLLGMLTVFGSLLAAVRRARRSPEGAVLPAPNSARWRISGPALAVSGAAGVVTLAAVGIAIVGASQQREEFSQLWLVPADTGTGTSGADNSGAGNSGEVEVGLRSMELKPTRFRVEVLAGERVALDAPDIELSIGQTWQTSLQVSPDLTAGASIEARVYRSDAPEAPYRRVELRPLQKG